jgi:cation transport protein ChaC
MRVSGNRPVWLFAYGSLLWRPGFEPSARVLGYVRGWSRRFWQGSTDHRGVPGAPGRVVTLAEGATEVCWGVAYLLDEAAQELILSELDRREQGGYERHVVTFQRADSDDGKVPLEVLVYVAGPLNPHYLGPSPMPQMVAQIRAARGPSGDNLDYVLRLSAALDALGVPDPHVRELASLLRLAAPPSREQAQGEREAPGRSLP